jgi:hypothetical protein
LLRAEQSAPDLPKASGCGSELAKSVYAILQDRLAAGEIRNLRREVRVELTAAKVPCKIDFAFEAAPDWRERFAEAKGDQSQFWRAYTKLWERYGPAPLDIWRGTAARPVITRAVAIDSRPSPLESKTTTRTFRSVRGMSRCRS